MDAALWNGNSEEAGEEGGRAAAGEREGREGVRVVEGWVKGFEKSPARCFSLR